MQQSNDSGLPDELIDPASQLYAGAATKLGLASLPLGANQRALGSAMVRPANVEIAGKPNNPDSSIEDRAM